MVPARPARSSVTACWHRGPMVQRRSIQVLDTNTCSWWSGSMENSCSVEGVSPPAGPGLPWPTAPVARTGAVVTPPTPPGYGRGAVVLPGGLCRRSPVAPAAARPAGQGSGGPGHRAHPVPSVGPSHHSHRPRRAEGPLCARPDRRRRTMLGVVGVAAVVLLGAPIWGHGGSGRSPAPEVVVVQPGDTLAGIVTQAVPSTQRAQVEARLRRELGGTVLVPGERLVVP